MSKHILIVGYGSVGQRHAGNLTELGCEISSVDPRPDRRADTSTNFETLEAALAAGSYDGAVVATPTAFHVAQAKTLLAAGIPVLLEKPISIDLAAAQDLAATQAQTQVPLLLGYTWRWWPPLAEVRARLDAGAIGRVIRVDFWMSAHLADWHPDEPLTDFFMSSATLGGGALLDESHWIDLMHWFFGPPSQIYGRVEKLSDLPISSDDHVDILARYDDGKRVCVHLDLIGRPHEKTIRFVGTGGTLVWSADPNEYRIGTSADQTWQVTPFTHTRNDMFQGVARTFLDMLDGPQRCGPQRVGGQPSCTLADGLATMRLIEALRKSSKEGREIALAEI